MSSSPFLGEIRLMSFNFAPKGWALCNGQLLPIIQNQALFALLGTTYGGDGQVNFALPNLQGRGPLHAGSNGQVNYTLGQAGGASQSTLGAQNLPVHSHLVNYANGPGTSNSPANALPAAQPAGSVPQYYDPSATPAGTMSSQMVVAAGSASPQPFSIENPYLTVTFCISLQGVFPSQN